MDSVSDVFSTFSATNFCFSELMAEGDLSPDDLPSADLPAELKGDLDVLYDQTPESPCRGRIRREHNNHDIRTYRKYVKQPL